jgi:hypothetical protein
VEVCDGIDNDCDAAVDEDLPPPGSTILFTHGLNVAETVVQWVPVEGASGYDVVRGSLRWITRA